MVVWLGKLTKKSEPLNKGLFKVFVIFIGVNEASDN